MPNPQTTPGHCLLRYEISTRDLRSPKGATRKIARGASPWKSSGFGVEPCKGGTPKSFLSVPPLQGSYLLLCPSQGLRPGLFHAAPLGLRREKRGTEIMGTTGFGDAHLSGHESTKVRKYESTNYRPSMVSSANMSTTASKLSVSSYFRSCRSALVPSLRMVRI